MRDGEGGEKVRWRGRERTREGEEGGSCQGHRAWQHCRVQLTFLRCSHGTPRSAALMNGRGTSCRRRAPLQEHHDQPRPATKKRSLEIPPCGGIRHGATMRFPIHSHRLTLVLTAGRRKTHSGIFGRGAKTYYCQNKEC